ncbi:SDR family NAD(P)-dependent oxidoreductase [Streptomyces litchfieldiae]|uniref:SDR family NAD(P)-dependent oxidoreductase n=1 Tax=Streptomyces litchfieldiae TaxID=3075543 RepID=A0ABU2N1D6_9ACTN|nr:SDR family NAD(P)-dependent oxidoreductase [Streptomyces sp. DSM 44938]MDT0347323.1 SDR family NAD(P)-dependent oxidoreductase [Streptomyces sp. DSM 44938]
MADIPDLTGRVAIVTRADSGPGLATTHRLAVNGARVVMACSDLGTAESAKRQVLGTTGVADERLEAWALDLTDQLSIDLFVGKLLRTCDRLDLLINDTGARSGSPQRPVPGVEPSVGVLHLGHMALTLGLLPLLVGTRGSRVVTVADQGRRLGPPRGLRGTGSVAVLFAVELARRLAAAGQGTLSLAAAPGSTQLRSWARGAVDTARTTLRAATDPDAASGLVYAPGPLGRSCPVPRGPRLRAKDRRAAVTFWRRSLRMLSQDEPPQLLPRPLAVVPFSI